MGLLLKAKRQGIVPQIKPLLQALNEANFHISEALMQKAIELSDEENH